MEIDTLTGEYIAHNIDCPKDILAYKDNMVFDLCYAPKSIDITCTNYHLSDDGNDEHRTITGLSLSLDDFKILVKKVEHFFEIKL